MKKFLFLLLLPFLFSGCFLFGGSKNAEKGNQNALKKYNNESAESLGSFDANSKKMQDTQKILNNQGPNAAEQELMK